MRLQPRLDVEDWQQHLRQELELRTVEGHVVEAERSRARAVAETAPTQPREFVSWFEQLREQSVAQSEGLFTWLAQRASRSEMSWFLAQEVASEHELPDLLALTQIKQGWRAKLEIARDYWDEMGQGNASATRARLLECLERELLMDATHPPAWECLARSNLMLALAANRRYAYHAIGALGLLELTAASPAASIDAGLSRLGVSAEARGFFGVRQRLAPLRAHAWNEHVILPLVAQDARSARAIAEGALMRLAADARCHRRYRAALDILAEPAE
ncbi:MAG: hypothetical protein K0R38_1234 [Polyangiaceae bacterium]|nr:hypothetical protein [Polyangiaceae bacterium]